MPSRPMLFLFVRRHGRRLDVESPSARLGRRPEAPVRNRTAAPALSLADADCGRAMINHDTRRKKLLAASPVSALSADKAYTLLELAEHLHPRTLYYWRKAIEWLANNHRRPTWLDVMGKPPSWRESLDEMKHWRKKSKRYDQVLRRSGILHTRLLTVIRDVIAAPDHLTQGVRPDGISAEVSRTVTDHLRIDLENGTLSTSRGMTLQEVTIWRGPLVPGKGNTPHRDYALVEHVIAEVKKSKGATSPRAVALTLAGKIPGGGTPESLAKRIAAKARTQLKREAPKAP